MTAATMQQTPAVPPRPSRSADKDVPATSMPKIPPRPANKRLDRSASPASDRFAPSPLSGGIPASKGKNKRLSPGYGSLDISDDPIDRSGSVPMPSVGEEGVEYSAVASELEDDTLAKVRSVSPEQTRTVAEDLQLHAPKPSLPAHSAKQRVQTVTRTDSDRAASYGIGQPAGTDERAISRDGLKKKPSSIMSTGSDLGHHTDDDHGIPEIGQRVPMNPNLGDVQAPSPGPGDNPRHHVRKHSARSLPPGSYGLHGHGAHPQDKLEKAYYLKHPDVLYREEHTPIHDRQNDFAMSSSDLNKLVRDTVNRGQDPANIRGTPTDEVAFQASEEYASRMSTPNPVASPSKAQEQAKSPLKQSFSSNVSGRDNDIIHVDDASHPEYRSYGNEDAVDDDEDHEYTAPILASDEIRKDPGAYLQHPAIHPGPERRGSSFEMEEGTSRPSSRPTSVHMPQSTHDYNSTPLEDVEEYEPLFPEETKKETESGVVADENKARHHFPSKDIWEDAPNSVHYTAMVSTPDLHEHVQRTSIDSRDDRSMTPAHAFAQHQEELAEQEANGARLEKVASLPSSAKPNWAAQQKHMRPAMGQRFPSRDIWEDVPESQLQQTTVTPPPATEQGKPQIPARPVKKLSGSSDRSTERPAVPERPKPRQGSGDDAAKPRPPVSDKPKPQVPARPAKTLSGDSKSGETPKTKPPVPNRPVGGKIAALQAGFMNDLNKRLQLGAQPIKKEEPPREEEQQEKEKAPLSDARKGRARGPQRRAPPKAVPSATSSTEASKPVIPTLTFTMPHTSWTIDPEEGDISVETESSEPLAKDISVKEEPPAEVLSAEKIKEPESVEDSSTGVTSAEVATEQPATSDENGSVSGPVEIEDPVEPKAEVEAAEETQEQQSTQESEEAKEPQVNEEKEEEAATTATEPEKTIEDEPAQVQEKTLAANMAGESILEAKVEKKDEGNKVEPVEVDDEVKP